MDTSVVQPLVLLSNLILKRLDIIFKMSTLFTNVYKKSDLGINFWHSLTFLDINFFETLFLLCFFCVHFVFMCDLEVCKSFVGWKTSLSLQLSMWSFKTWKWVLKLSLCARLERRKNGSQAFFLIFFFEAKRKDIYFFGL